MRYLRALLLTCLLLPAWSFPTAAQEELAKQQAAEAAIAFSRMEAAGDFDQLHDEMHPDAKAIVSREVVVGWHESEFAPLGPGVSTVSMVVIVPWVWEVTGQLYPDTAIVAYRQPFADGSVVDGNVRLVQDEFGEWRWFFGRSREFLDEQIAIYGGSSSRPASAVTAPAPAQAAAPVTDPRIGALETQVAQLERTVEAETRRSKALATTVASLERDTADLETRIAALEQSAATRTAEAPTQVTDEPTSTPTPASAQETPTPVPPPTRTPTPEPVLEPTPVVSEVSTTEAAYLDPRLMVADPQGHVGELIYVHGVAHSIEQSGDLTGIALIPEVRGEGPLPDFIVVHLRPAVAGLLTFECYRFTGEVTGTIEVVQLDSGVPITVPLIEATSYEPIPEDGVVGFCQSP